jgi:dienelactone hydrolase
MYQNPAAGLWWWEPGKRESVMKQNKGRSLVASFLLLAAAVAAAGRPQQPDRAQVHPFVQKRLVYQAPAMKDVSRSRGIPYDSESGSSLKLDIYFPPHSDRGHKLPLVILISGYPDSAIKKFYGVNQKDLGLFDSWAELIAASGMIAVRYESERSAGETDRAIAFLRKNAGAFGIDPERIALFGCSANTLTAQSMMQDPVPGIKCAVFYYPILATPDGRDTDIIAASAKRFGFYWDGLKKMGQISKNIPLFVVSVGKESHPEVKDTTDHFVREAMSLGIPLTYIHYAGGQHDFDVMDDTEEARSIIRQTVDFLKTHLMQ